MDACRAALRYLPHDGTPGYRAACIVDLASEAVRNAVRESALNIPGVDVANPADVSRAALDTARDGLIDALEHSLGEHGRGWQSSGPDADGLLPQAFVDRYNRAADAREGGEYGDVEDGNAMVDAIAALYVDADAGDDSTVAYLRRLSTTELLALAAFNTSFAALDLSLLADSPKTGVDRNARLIQAIHHTAQARVVLNRIDEWELPDDALSSAYGPEVRKAARQLGYWINRLLAEVGQGGQQQPDVENCQNCGQPPDHPAQHGPGLCYCNPYPPLP